MNHMPPPRPSDTSPTTEPSVVKGPSVTFDWSEWLPYLDHMDATPDQKRALIENLWSIILAFVDLGFAVKGPPETSGKLPDLRGDLARAVVNSKENNKEGAHENT